MKDWMEWVSGPLTDSISRLVRKRRLHLLLAKRLCNPSLIAHTSTKPSRPKDRGSRLRSQVPELLQFPRAKLRPHSSATRAPMPLEPLHKPRIWSGLLRHQPRKLFNQVVPVLSWRSKWARKSQMKTGSILRDPLIRAKSSSLLGRLPRQPLRWAPTIVWRTPRQPC